MVWHITVLKASIQLCVPVWCGTSQFIKLDTINCACMMWHITVYKDLRTNWGTIICACMVRHRTAQQFLIITVQILKVLIHLFELTSCMVQHSMISKMINKNVLMVKLSNSS